MAAEDYTVKKITDVAESTTADTLFIKSGSDIKQISPANLLAQLYPDIELAALKKQMPVGYTFAWDQTSGLGFDLSTAEKVAAYYGFGTWEQVKDKFLLGAGDDYEVGSTGGEATHTLSIDEMPSHSHNYGSVRQDADPDTSGAHGYKWSDINNSQTTTSAGGNKAHNNMPPYVTVYIWRRIA